LLSVVVPVLDEREALPGLVNSLAAQVRPGPLELILADGGSRDGTMERFRELTADWCDGRRSARIVTSGATGRALQMNAGAAAARGEGLIFLHADTQLPEGGIAAVRRVLADPRVVGGGFRHRFRERGALLRAISLWATARSRLTGIHYGDQALFVRRAVFERLGGFPPIELFEDLRLARRLRRAGRVVTLRLSVSTSARRFIRGGVVRTACRLAWLKTLHAVGATTGRLRRRYPDVR
jgi:rSAM/selenodomain-associated transferase 2